MTQMKTDITEKLVNDVRVISERTETADSGMQQVISRCKKAVDDIVATLNELKLHRVKDDATLVKAIKKMVDDVFMISCYLEHQAGFYVEVLGTAEESINNTLRELGEAK